MYSILMILISSVLSALAMPGFLSSILIWFSISFLLKALESKGPLKSFFLSYLYGAIFLGIAFFWQLPTMMRELPNVIGSFSSLVGVIVFLLELVIGAPMFALFGLLYSLLRKFFKKGLFTYSLFVASLFTLFEHLRGLGPLGFTGGRLSDALYNEKGLLQILPLTGTLGLVFLIVFVNALIYGIWTERKTYRFCKILLIISMMYVFNSMLSTYLIPEQMIGGVKEPFKVMALQTNVSQYDKYLGDLNELTNELFSLAKRAKESGKNADLYVFPEAAFIVDVEDIPDLKKKIENLTNEIGVSLLVGYPSIGNKKYNQVRLVKPQVGFTEEFYAKIKLTPFAEMLPFPKIFGMFSFLKLIDYYDPGPEFHVFDLNGEKFSIQICFESFFPEISRNLVRNGANFLITVTNDGWFRQKVALTQHFTKGIFRAVENRRYVLQVSNTGITGLVDPYGRIVKTLPVKEESFSVFEVYENNGFTFYNKHGDWFVIFCLILLVSTFTIRRWNL